MHTRLILLKISYRDQWYKPYTSSITIFYNNELVKAMSSRMQQELFTFNTEIMICGAFVVTLVPTKNDIMVYTVHISLEI